MTQLWQRGKRMLVVDRAFEGEGVNVYATAGTSVTYRRTRVMPSGLTQFLRGTGKDDYNSWPMTLRAGQAASPATSFEYTIPASMIPGTGETAYVTFDIRKYKSDVENQTTNYKTQTVLIDENGDVVSAILGTGAFIRQEQRSGGDVKLWFRYYPTTNGIAPDLFRLTRTAGPTSPADVTVDYVEGQGLYETTLESLSDASVYTYSLIAENTAGTITTTLQSGYSITADATGPGTVSDVEATTV